VLLALPVIYFASPYVSIFVAEMNLWEYFTSNIIGILLYQALFGIVLGVISSVIAVRKHIRV